MNGHFMYIYLLSYFISFHLFCKIKSTRIIKSDGAYSTYALGRGLEGVQEFPFKEKYVIPSLVT